MEKSMFKTDEEELFLIEKLSDELERIYKDMEHYRRENILFENYLSRVLENDNIDMKKFKVK